MNFYQAIQELLIRFFIHPFHKPETISYKTAFQKARSAIVICPDINLLGPIHDKMSKIFSRMKTTYVIALSRNQVPEQIPLKAPVYFIPHYSLFKIGRNEHYSALKNQSFDILLDFSQKPLVLSMLLSRKLLPGLSFGLKKEYSQNYYNLQYSIDQSQSPDRQLKSIFEFLEKITPGKSQTSD
jgi:hypothetical protein